MTVSTSLVAAAPVRTTSVGPGGTWSWLGLRQGGASPVPMVAV
jgi:hypothetical protein